MAAVMQPQPLSTPRPAPQDQRAHLRVVPPSTASVYRRRRIVAAAVAAVLLLGGVWAVRAVASVLGGDPASISEDGVASARLAPGSAYVVEPGDTLWGIAGRISSDRGRADLVQAMVDALGGPRLRAGDVVVLPG